MFEIQVARAPEAVAVTFGGSRLTYGELNRRANQLAHHLRSLGVGPEVLVALCAERSLDAIVGLLGVLKAGGAYVPVDPTYPRERIAFMLEDAGAPVLLTQARLLPSLPRHKARVVLLDGDREAIARCSDRDPQNEAGPDHLAYVIYTSGSTGRPKGAMLAHRGLTNLARVLCERFEVGPGSRVLQFASLSFDASVWEIAMALASGATLVMGTREEVMPGPGLVELLRAREVTMALFPPSALAAMPDGAEANLRTLRTLIAEGEASRGELVARWARGRRFFKAYGSTEVTVIATVAECGEASDAPSIGLPITGTRGLVLDAAMRPVPDGEVGELYLGGVGLARGYLRRPDLTAARFVPDPFVPTPGSRLYRTGDLVRRNPGGDLEFLGLLDALPLTPSGKVDRAALPAPDPRGPEGVDERKNALPAERQDLLRSGTAPAGRGADSCVHRLFEAEAERSPDAEAVVFDDGAGGVASLSYGELNRRANQLARHLLRHGAAPEDRVAICMYRSIELIVAMLGTLKAGLAFVPVDPTYPTERIAFMLEQTGARVMLTQARIGDVLPGSSTRVLWLDTRWEEIEREDDTNLAVPMSPEQLAYVMFTSGSSGRPKGVAVPHRGIARLVKGTTYASFSPDEVFLQFATVSFDASTFEIWGALLNGARLIVMPPAPPSLEELGKIIRRYGVTTAWLTAGMFHLLVDERIDDLRHLRQLLAGGDALSPRHVNRVVEEIPGCRMINGYGPTESTTFTCCHTVDHPVDRTVPIGRPIPGTQVHVLDKHLREVPIGTPGELYIGGPGLARGYIGRPDLTAERFIPDPTGGEPGSRLYRTGDQVRWTADGLIEFLGRLDQQVKIRGYRIEPGEIEAALGTLPAVRDAVVMALADRAGDKRLVAYVVPRPGVGAPGGLERMVLDHLQTRLPEYMIPVAVVEMAQLPLTANGKVDRRALPTPEDLRPAAALSVAPRSLLEERVAAAWADALGLPRIGVDDDVFELGGHSLLVMRVQSRLRRALGVSIPLELLFEARTAAALARAVAELRPEGRCEGDEGIRKAPRGGRLPLSHGQQQIWLHQKLNPGALFYNEPFSIRIPGRLDVAAFARAFGELVRRHEAWRTTFPTVEGEPVQRIHPPGPIDLPLLDLMDLPESTRWQRAIAIATEEARLPLDVENGPLFRATIVRLGDEDHALFVTAHHILTDGMSLFGVLPRELEALYHAFSTGAPSPLPELPIQYADYAVWERERRSRSALASHFDYWKRQLADLPTLELPTDRPRPASPSALGARHCIALSRDLTLRLKALARQQGTTLFVVLLAAFKSLLYRYVRQDEIVVGTTAACRDRSEIEGLLGFFLSTLVLRTDLRGDPTFRQLLGRVQEVTRAALAHQRLPFTSLVEELQPKRSPGQTPFFQVAFVLEPSAPPLESGWIVSQLDIDTGTSKFDLTVELDERSEGIIGRIEYNTDLFDASTIERMAGHYEVLLDGASADIDRHLSALPLLTHGERRTLLEWGTAPPGPGSELCIHDIFEAQAERAPDAVAVVFDDGAGRATSITYGELNRRANRLANHLLRLGGPREERVVICMYRSPDLIVAILGALKAGRSFVPLDPAYPTERLAFMAEQARAGVMITLAHLAGTLPARQTHFVCLDADEQVLREESEENPHTPASPDQLAYVMYTSGSTGQPKGVAIPHRGVARLVKGTDFASFSADEVFLQLAPISFDAAQLEIWGPLLNGGRLVIMSHAPPSLEDIGRVIREEGVTTLALVAGTFHVLVDEQIGHLRSLRQVIVGGEPLSPRHANRVLDEVPGCRLINAYGPTEDSNTATAYQVIRPEGHAVPLGRPIPGTRLHVLDEMLREVPIGVPGELFLGGEGLARGYFGRPDLTAERFIPDPTGSAPGERLYRTGDRTRWRSDGVLEFLGRVDHQVKIRGYRVEPGEIEAIVRAHPAVRDALVAAREDRPGDKRLVAYVVPHRRADISGGLERALLDDLQPRLPDYMMPSAIVTLDQLPLSANGKVDRRALPAPEEARPEGAPIVAPRSMLEEHLAELWQEVLGVDRVGVHDNFFDIGGHSLLLMRLHERIRERFRQNITTMDLLARPTISDLAAYLESGAGEADLGGADVRARKQRETLRRKKLAAAQSKSK